MNLPASLPSSVQWLAKSFVLMLVGYLAVRHELTAEAAAVLSAALLSLGVTNGATMIAAARAASLVPGSTTTTVTTIPPPAGPPPAPPPLPYAGPVAGLLFAAAGGLLLGASLVACAAKEPLSPADNARVGAELGEQLACVDAHRGDVPATDACRADVKAKWNARWARELDGGAP